MAHRAERATVDLKGDVNGNHANDEVKERSIKVDINALFLVKLHSILYFAEQNGLKDIVSWAWHGRCFKIHKPQEFFEQIVTRFFNQSTLASFHRQLNLYEFKRLNGGQDIGSHYHEFFVRGNPPLAQHMIRTKVKGTQVKGARIKAAINPNGEPDFYAFPPLESTRRDGETKTVDATATTNNDTDIGTNSSRVSESQSCPSTSPVLASTIDAPVHDTDRESAFKLTTTVSQDDGDSTLDGMVAELWEMGESYTESTMLKGLGDDSQSDYALDEDWLTSLMEEPW